MCFGRIGSILSTVLKIVGIIFLSLIAFLIIFISISTFTINSEIDSKFTYYKSSDTEKIRNEVKTSLESFQKEKTKKKFIKFSANEFAVFFIDSLTKASQGNITADKFYVEKCDDNEFLFSMYITLKNVPLGWFEVSILKNDFESVYLYIDYIKWNKVPLPRFLINKINYSIKRGILLINDEGSSDFVLDNIEFVQDMVIIRGHYTNLSF